MIHKQLTFSLVKVNIGLCKFLDTVHPEYHLLCEMSQTVDKLLIGCVAPSYMRVSVKDHTVDLHRNVETRTRTGMQVLR